MTVSKPFWFAEFLFWGLPQITVHGSYEKALDASTANKRPWKRFVRVSGPHYYEVPA